MSEESAARGRVLLIVSGGIAAYKVLETIRRLKQAGVAVRCVLTRGGAEFVTPLSLQALSEDRVYTDLFSLTDESEMGHIELSRQADLVVVAPASADLLAKMAAGLADDLAATVLLATDKPVLVAPAMNVRMWEHPATQDNLATLIRRGVSLIGPNEGPMACGEYGPGRLVEPADLAAAILRRLGAGAGEAEERAQPAAGPLAGRKALVTSGPTHEPIDPVRYIANRSSGRQGHAIAEALAALGAEVTLVSGPTHLPDPPGLATVRIESAEEMLAACRAALPVDIAVCAAAVADWTVKARGAAKIKKQAGGPPPALELAENPDILKTLSAPGAERPALVVGFAAETEEVAQLGAKKRARKGCDWILANDVSEGTGTFGGDENTVTLITAEGAEPWPTQTKRAVAARLAERIAAHFEDPSRTGAAGKAAE
ncbi:MAG: bifunctional phosphopantothenoylcysteine decarboxylase/phosphopantothenate--cysteine ligase CoaBC [Alphaproteobacteria bacterium]|nr:bifunctional phosphopantothenoylcysteine decarboxylase/phosphopantothenate--cysteine ligase CoaBC [Alphaproteobacteria bacterium]